MPTKGLIERQRIGKDILQSARTHSRAVGERLNERLQFTVEEGESLPDFITLQHQLARLLESRLDALAEADRAHLQELNDDREPRVRRDQAARVLYDKLIEVRELTKGFFGTDLANALVGIDGPTSQDPLILQDQATEALEGLREPSPKLPPQRLTSVPFDRNAVADELQPFVDTVGEILEEVKREGREREATKGRRDEAIRRFDIASRAIGRIQIGLDELAELPHFAEKIRLTLPSRGGRVPDDDQEVPELPAPEELPDGETIQTIGFNPAERSIPPTRVEPTQEPETS
jgi:hypothetical protein